MTMTGQCLWVCGSKEVATEEGLGFLGMHSVYYSMGCFIHFSHNAAQLLLKPCHLSRNLRLLLDQLAHHSYFAFWAPFVFWRQIFTK
jgi:hypothetical protein